MKYHLRKMERGKCETCAALRTEYWTKVKAVEEVRSALSHCEADSQRAAALKGLLDAADDERIAARDALVRHRERCQLVV